MKKTIFGVGLMICGAIGVSTEVLREVILVANHWQVKEGGLNLLWWGSIAAMIAGVVLCVISLLKSDE